jgi:hypothetical protein
MAKIHIERAYIEPFDEETESHQILIHVKQVNDKGQIDHIFAGKVELTHNIQWLHTYTAENGDLVINNSAGMEANKWDYLTREIIDNG